MPPALPKCKDQPLRALTPVERRLVHILARPEDDRDEARCSSFLGDDRHGAGRGCPPAARRPLAGDHALTGSWPRRSSLAARRHAGSWSAAAPSTPRSPRTRPSADGARDERIGGDLYLYWTRRPKAHGLNASGWRAHGLTPQSLAAKGVTTMPRTAPRPSPFPGRSRDGRRSGTSSARSRLGLLAPAIHYASEGFPVGEITAEAWAAASAGGPPSASRTYLPERPAARDRPAVQRTLTSRARSRASPSEGATASATRARRPTRS